MSSSEEKYTAIFINRVFNPLRFSEKSDMKPRKAVTGRFRVATDRKALDLAYMLLPFGAHKGSALATLSALLSLALVPGSEYVEGFGLPGTFILAIDAGLFRDRSEVEKEADSMLAKIKAVPPAAGFSEVMVPGEPEVRSAERRGRDGIPLPDDTWTAIANTALHVGLGDNRIKAALA